MSTKPRGGVGFLLAAIGGCMVVPCALAQESKSLQDMLLVAIRMGDLRTVHQIVESGIDVARRGYNGKTAIDVAVDLGKFDIAEYLVSERGRQEASANATLVAAKGTAPKPTAEIVQPSPEAAPEVKASPAAAAPAPPPVTPQPIAATGTPGMEQLLTAISQLTSAVQVFMQAQHAQQAQQPIDVGRLRATPVSAGPASQRAESGDSDASLAMFAPLPGRKPEYTGPLQQQASLDPKASTILVTPRKRLSDSTIERLKRQLDDPSAADAPPSGGTEANPFSPNAAVTAPVASPIAPPPVPPLASEPAAPLPVPQAKREESSNGFFGSIKNFLGIGLSAPPPASATASALSMPPPEADAEPVLTYMELDKDTGEAVVADALPADRPRRVTPAPQIVAAASPPSASVASVAAAAGPPRSLEPAPAAPPVSTLAAIPPVPPLPETANKRRKSDQAFGDSPGIQRRPLPSDDDPTVLDSIATAIGLGDDSDSKPPERISSQAPDKMPLFNLREPLIGTKLALGSITTGAARPTRGVGPDPCLKRPNPNVAFCVVPIDWPREITPVFSVSTYLYQGPRAIVRYDNGKASHYHALFASESYDAVVQFMTRRYGPPTDEWKRYVSPFDKPRQPDRTLVWRARDTRTNVVTVMEVREFDDTRTVFPDMSHGVVRLYTAGAPRIFPEISQVDIMGIDWMARSDGNDAISPMAAARISGGGVRR